MLAQVEIALFTYPPAPFTVREVGVAEGGGG